MPDSFPNTTWYSVLITDASTTSLLMFLNTDVYTSPNTPNVYKAKREKDINPLDRERQRELCLFKYTYQILRAQENPNWCHLPCNCFLLLQQVLLQCNFGQSNKHYQERGCKKLIRSTVYQWYPKSPHCASTLVKSPSLTCPCRAG